MTCHTVIHTKRFDTSMLCLCGFICIEASRCDLSHCCEHLEANTSVLVFEHERSSIHCGFTYIEASKCELPGCCVHEMSDTTLLWHSQCHSAQTLMITYALRMDTVSR